MAAIIGLGLALAAPAGLAQEGQEVNPVAALTSALVGACRQNEAQFVRYLTAENAAVFRELAQPQRREVMRRFLLMDEPGRPLLSSDARGKTVLRCETPGATAVIHYGDERIGENLAFVPLELSGGRRVEIGMVREGGGWRIVSVGLLLFHLAELQKQWVEQELERKEEAAIAGLKELAEAVQKFRRAFGALPDTLKQLGPAGSEGVSPEAASLVDAKLASGAKGGYRFRYRAVPAKEAGGEAGFELAAVPSEYGQTGRRSFFLDQAGKLRGGDKQGAVATAADPVIEPR
jgi:hypothetical protein